jgi:hypothetical protein
MLILFGVKIHLASGQFVLLPSKIKSSLRRFGYRRRAMGECSDTIDPNRTSAHSGAAEFGHSAVKIALCWRLRSRSH